MKVIFLDIDGVINPTINQQLRDNLEKKSDGVLKSRDDYGYLFADWCVKELEKLTRETGANIVVSSSWKLSGLQIMQEMWAKRGLNGFVVDTTINFADSHRGKEIDEWIKRNRPTKYVILDDEPVKFPELEKKQIKTDPKYGLLPQHTKEAKKILLG